MTELLIATKNAHKLREVREILGDIEGIDLVSLHAFPDYTPPPETGKTFEENAKLKALHAAKTLDCLALADDSGLVVPALGGKPGVYSARYAGEDASDLDNRRKLIKEMQGLEGLQRSAYFACVMALASSEGILACEMGTCEGEILAEERGSHGFGYDSLFLKHDYRKTLAQLDPDVKNRISHRRKALDKLAEFLASIAVSS